MIFIVIKNEQLIQLEDKTRFDVSKSFANNGESFDTVTISVNSGTTIDITENLYLDYAFVSGDEGTATIDVEITSGIDSFNKQATIQVVTAAEDNLFSTDKDIVPIQTDILDYVKDGRTSHLDKHREAQAIILNDLDANEHWKQNGSRYTAADIVDIQEFKEWSKYVTLKLIMMDNSNQIEDIFMQKAQDYKSYIVNAKKRAIFRLDYNGDGEINENTEKEQNQTGYLQRR